MQRWRRSKTHSLRWQKSMVIRSSAVDWNLNQLYMIHCAKICETFLNDIYGMNDIFGWQIDILSAKKALHSIYMGGRILYMVIYYNSSHRSVAFNFNWRWCHWCEIKLPVISSCQCQLSINKHVTSVMENVICVFVCDYCDSDSMLGE